jgi:NAD(P)-dependent dehydrogenase (short-subunit alcohol dehydrogenase family)
VKRAFVSGCSSGIGRAVAASLLADGWAVVGASRRYPQCFRDEPHFDWEAVEVSSAYRMDAATFRFEDRLDALVHCAAVQGPIGGLDDCDIGAWLGCVRTNLLGTYHAVRVALPYLRRSEDARILLLAGGGAFNARPGYSAYAASKAGVVSLMETLAEELKGTSVGVNCVSPGYVPTPMHGLPDEGSPQMERAVACIRHLLAPETRGVTGRTISAEYDGWASITPETVPFLMASQMGTRTRHKVWPLESDGSYVHRTDANVSEGVTA